MTDDHNFGSARSFGFRAPRISTNFSFTLEVIATGQRYDAICTDLSEDGLAAEMPASLPAKTLVVMRLLLPGAMQPVPIRGTVEYNQQQRCGVTFLYSSPEERQQIQSFIQSAS